MPPLQYPFNYIHINPKEMTKGFNGEICMIKAYELGLRNIKGKWIRENKMYFYNLGYFAVADDAILNFWQPFNLDMVFHQWGTKYAAKGHKHYWTWDIGNFHIHRV